MNVNNNRPFTVAPTNSSNSNYRSYEYFDLDDIFEDDFFPAGLDFSDMILPPNAAHIDQLMMPPFPSSSFFQAPTAPSSSSASSSSSSSFPSSSSSSFPSSSAAQPYPYVKLEKKEGDQRGYYNYDSNVSSSKVIMIPPKMPTQQLVYKSNNAAIGDKKPVIVKTEDGNGSEPKKQRILKDSSEDESKVERRERNREHAKRSRIRKRLLLDSLQDQLAAVRTENIKLRRLVVETLPPSVAQQVLMDCTTEESNLLKLGSSDRESDGESILGSSGPIAYVKAQENFIGDGAGIGVKKVSPLTSNIALHHPLLTSSIDALNSAGGKAERDKKLLESNTKGNSSGGKIERERKLLMEPDYRLMESLVISQQNFVLSDPSLPDNPIVYCSDGFCKLSGYKRSEVVGRNCRFLQGPGTDQAAVDIIRQGVDDGRDISVCLLNYKADATPFWNQFFVAPIKDDNGQVVNYVGVQCEVNTMPIHEIKERVKKLPIPTDSYTMKQLNESSSR